MSSDQITTTLVQEESKTEVSDQPSQAEGSLQKSSAQDEASTDQNHPLQEKGAQEEAV